MAGPNSGLYMSVYKGFIVAAVIAFVMGIATNGATSLNCYQAGYSVFAIAVMMILITILNNLLSPGESGAPTKGMLNMILNTTPLLLILTIVGFLIYFNVKYKKIIIEGRVSEGYNIFSNIAIVLLIIQLFVVYSSISKEDFDEKGMSKVTGSIVLLLAVLTAICTNILRTILQYFSTDGFKEQYQDIIKI